MCILAFMPAQSVFLKIVPLYFFNFYVGEESSQPTKHANKTIIMIFSIMKATILDAHGSSKTSLTEPNWPYREPSQGLHAQRTARLMFKNVTKLPT